MRACPILLARDSPLDDVDGAAGSAASATDSVAADAGGAAVRAVLSADLRPAMAEVVRSAQARVSTALIAKMRALASDGRLDEARRLWCAGSAELRSSACDDAFREIVRGHFASFARSISDTLATARADSVGRAPEPGAEAHDFGRGEALSAATHPYLLSHLALLADATGVPLELPSPDNGLREDRDRNQEGSPPRPQPPAAHAVAGARLQSELEALSSLLGEASTWMAMVLDQPVPHASRCLVAAELHAACVEAAVPVVKAVREDGMIAASACVARSLLELADGRLSNREKCACTRSEWESAVRGAAAHLESQSLSNVSGASQSSCGSDGDGEAGASRSAEAAFRSSGSSGAALSFAVADAEPVILVNFDSLNPPPSHQARGGRGGVGPVAAARRQAAQGDAGDDLVFYNPQHDQKSPNGTLSVSSHVLVPLALPVSGAVAAVDQACDQATFLCQLLERYLRCVTVCLGLGTGDQPSRTSDVLADAMHSLQGEYVLLERAYLTTAVARAVQRPQQAHAAQWPSPPSGSDGWSVVVMGDNPRELCFAWADHALFVLSKSIARACATCCDLAAAAVVNFVAGCVDEHLRAVARVCVTLCSTMRPPPELAADGSSGSGGTVGGGSAGGADRDAVEEEMARQLATALEVDEPGDDNERIARPSGGGMLRDDKDAAILRAVAAKREPRASDEALHALNTVATVAGYLLSLHSRTRNEVEAVFPPPQAAGSASSGADAGRAAHSAASAKSDLRGSHPPLCHPFLVGPLDLLGSVARSFAEIADEAALALAQTLAGPGLAEMRALLEDAAAARFDGGGARYSYELSEAAFDRLTSGAGAGGAGGDALLSKTA